MVTLWTQLLIWGIVALSLVASSSAQNSILCNDDNDCVIHCPLTHEGHCHSKRCTCEIHPTYVCNDANDCRVHCPVTHSGVCSQSKCACNPIQDSFFCNDDSDCRFHCPLTHVGNCQNKGSNNQTCTCNYHPSIPCHSDGECHFHCPVTHRGSCKSDRICSCDPIPAWLIPSTATPMTNPTTADTTTMKQYSCLNSIDCEVHCPNTHIGACGQDNTCACDPHVSGNPISCHATEDCIRHCIGTHVGSCQSHSKTCRCLLGSDSILG